MKTMTLSLISLTIILLMAVSCKTTQEQSNEASQASQLNSASNMDNEQDNWIKEYVESEEYQGEKWGGYNIYKKRVIAESSFVKELCMKPGIYDMLWYKEGENRAEAKKVKSSELIVYCLAEK